METKASNQQQDKGVFAIKARCLSLFRKCVKYSCYVLTSLAFCLFFVDGLIGYYVKDRIYDDINKLPQTDYAVVLGTSKYYSKGVANLFYKYRIDAVLDLFKQEKIKNILISGDNKTPYYNEPKLMFNDLRKQGVRREFLQQDFAGYRTLDSILRAKAVFNLNSFVIVTQEFHCERALFIAVSHNIDAICYAAKYPQGEFKVRIREMFARLGMLYDLLIGRMPETLDRVVEKEVK